MRQARTAVAYCRTSTRRQAESETIHAQVERCKAILQREGLNLLPYGPNSDGWVVDDGISGTLLEGRAFKQLMDDIKHEVIKPDALVVFSVSRIARVDTVNPDPQKIYQSYADNGVIRGTLMAAQITVIDESGCHSPGDNMLEFKLMMANEEFKLIRSRTMNGKEFRLTLGQFAKGGKPPYGYIQRPVNGVDRRQGFKLEAHPEEAGRLHQLIAWYITGGFTYAARMATENSFPTPMFRTDARRNQAADWSPTRWSPVSVQHIMKNIRSYLGEISMVFNKKPVTILAPPLVDLRTVLDVERRIAERTLKKRTKFLSTGFVDCACGAHVHNRLSSKNHYTTCGNRCGSIRQENFDPYLWTATLLRMIQLKKEFLSAGGRALSRVGETDASIEYKKLEIRRKREEMNSTIITISKTSVPPATLNEVVKHFQAQIDELSRELAAMSQKLEILQRSRNESQRTLARFSQAENQTVFTLDQMREYLQMVLSGGRVIVSKWVNLQGGMYPELEFPPFGEIFDGVTIVPTVREDVSGEKHVVAGGRHYGWIPSERNSRFIYVNVDQAKKNILSKKIRQTFLEIQQKISKTPRQGTDDDR